MAGDSSAIGVSTWRTELTGRALLPREPVRQDLGPLVNLFALTYVITLATAQTMTGLVQVRQLDSSFEAAEWECTIAPSSGGCGVFLEATASRGH